MLNAKVLGLNGFGLVVPDLQQAKTFYQTFGLDSRQQGDALLLRSPGRDNDELVLTPGPCKRLHHVSFYIDPGQQSAFTDQLGRVGIKVSRTAPAGGQREGLWFQDPWGVWINLTPHIPSAIREENNLPLNDPDQRQRIDVAAWEEMGAGRPPLRLGHMLIFTPDLAANERFLCDQLGMRVTDRATGKVAFLGAGSGVIDHHCFGLIQGTHSGFQHASFQMPSFDDIGFGAGRMRAAGSVMRAPLRSQTNSSVHSTAQTSRPRMPALALIWPISAMPAPSVRPVSASMSKKANRRLKRNELPNGRRVMGNL